MTDTSASMDGLRKDLAKLVRQLLDERPERRRERPVNPLVRAHLGLGDGAPTLPVLSDRFPYYDLPNLHLALERLRTREGWSADILGVAHEEGMWPQPTMGSLLSHDRWEAGPEQFATASTGPGETMACRTSSLFLLHSPEGPLALLLMLSDGHGGPPDLILTVASPVDGACERLLAWIRETIAEVDVFRGKVITVEANPMTDSSRVAFVERPRIAPQELVLPDGVLERIERHVIGASRHREALLASGRHLGRGLLLWGPPGTGKTLTLRYLTGRLDGTTVIILSGSALGMAASFGALARRLQPAVVILEDVDLVAQEREHWGSGPILFELMNEMSGQGGDADVAFVLTTNRPDVLEPALAARPGRVDLAVEIPLPDAAARARLIELYGRGMDLRLDDPDRVVGRTEGVTASFIQELLRKARLWAAEDGRVTVTQADVDGALDELLHETSALTRVMLGVGAQDVMRRASRAWLEEFPDEE